MPTEFSRCEFETREWKEMVTVFVFGVGSGIGVGRVVEAFGEIVREASLPDPVDFILKMGLTFVQEVGGPLAALPNAIFSFLSRF
jgi:hypothetical protein